jgi:hypothetical protein
LLRLSAKRDFLHEGALKAQRRAKPKPQTVGLQAAGCEKAGEKPLSAGEKPGHPGGERNFEFLERRGKGGEKQRSGGLSLSGRGIQEKLRRADPFNP